ncbi:hypothetical protein KTJ34_01730 [Acinetobacter courvalinii]|uniref:phage tail fiber protein n=1 Tax=Acinetobacter courvalinii TaxID=280147 RepID=UPI0021CFF50B|nr:hypothetical protein [Acinetobacter courvalinii]MCU4576132.1 hypothetical protein [Acinetobacter courvalinii]
MATITSANSTFTLTATDVFPAPQVLQGYATDDAFATDAIDLAEAIMGVDGKLSAGYTPNPTKITVALQADSPSIAVFDAIISATKAGREVIFLDAAIGLPATGTNYTFTRGVITNANQLPDAKKTLQPQKYQITFESVTKAVV